MILIFFISSHVLKVTKFLVKISQFKFLVMAEKNIFVYKLFVPQALARRVLSNRVSPSIDPTFHPSFHLSGHFLGIVSLGFYICIMCSVMKIYHICCIPAQIPYFGKFWLLRYRPKCSQPMRL